MRAESNRLGILTSAAVSIACVALVSSVGTYAQATGAHANLATGEAARAFIEISITAAFDEESIVRLLPAGEWEANGLTLHDLIRMAYTREGIHAASQILEGPAWAESARYRIRATMNQTPAGPSFLAELQLVPLRKLLADRFALRVGFETREAPVYDLVKVNSETFGSRMALSACARKIPVILYTGVNHCPPARFAAAGVVEGVSMSELAAALSALPDVGRLVRDRTGLIQDFDLQLQWAGSRLADPRHDVVPTTPDQNASSMHLLTALHAQLGLTLIESIARIPILVVNHVEQPVLDE